MNNENEPSLIFETTLATLNCSSPIDTRLNVTAHPPRTINFTFSIGSIIKVTRSIRMRKVSASVISDANSSALLTSTGLVSKRTRVIAIIVPTSQSVVAHLPVTSRHGCHRQDGNEEKNRQGRDLHPVKVKEL